MCSHMAGSSVVLRWVLHKELNAQGSFNLLVISEWYQLGNVCCSEDQFGVSCADENLEQQLRHVEGTVILHVTFAVKQDQQLGREFVSYFKVSFAFGYLTGHVPFLMNNQVRFLKSFS